MADTKITALTALTAADPANDVIPIVDVSDTTMAASGTTKKISVNNILSSSPTASGALTVTGLVTAGSATITGDLTVRTNKLFVNATGVGVGTTSLFGDLNIQNGTNCRFELGSAAGGTVIENLNNARNAYLDMTMYADAYIWNRLGSEVMRLNSTGLGVGGSPTRKLSIVGSGNTYANINSGDNTSLVGVLFGGTSAPSNGQIIYNNTDNSMGLHTAGAVKLTIDATGNLGIGVTPSAWDTNYKALQLGYPNFISGNNGGNIIDIGVNAYFNTDWKYAASSVAATRYRQVVGVHQWYTAPSGTAGNAITWTQAMTLDASGRLILLASTTTPATLATNGELTFTATSNTNLRFSYRGSDGVTRTADLTLA